MFLKDTEELRDYLQFDNRHPEDPFWYGEGQVFQLVFLADENGPAEHQLETYMDFQHYHLSYIDRIRQRVADAWEREKGRVPSRIQHDVPMVDVITVNPPGEEADMDIVLSFRRFKLLFYSAWTTYVAKFKGRQLVYLQTARRYEQEMKEKENVRIE
ncbi:MAG: hypothetical protein ACOC2C_00460 [Cyclonatronaceae bacterium]